MWGNGTGKSRPSDSECVFLPIANLIANADGHRSSSLLSEFDDDLAQQRTREREREAKSGGAGEAINANGLNIIAERDASNVDHEREEKKRREVKPHLCTENGNSTERPACPMHLHYSIGALSGFSSS